MTRRVCLLVLLLALPAFPAEVLPAGSLITRPANYFDLEGNTITYTPSGERSYQVQVGESRFREDLGDPVGPADAQHPRGRAASDRQNQPYAKSWRVKLPFDFPFGGAVWKEVFVNSTGSLSFGRSEAENHGERNAWADGTVRAVAAAIDVRGAMGIEQNIMALWQIYGSRPEQTKIQHKASPGELVVTWNVALRQLPDVGYAPLGQNEFQAVLSKDGKIELNYRSVAERDGIVGVFPGTLGEFTRIDQASDPQADAPGEVDILSAEVAESGTILRFTLDMAQPVAERPGSGSSLSYRFTLKSGAAECDVSFSAGRGASSSCAGAPPRGAGAQVQGRKLELFLSKTALDDPQNFSWRVAVRRGSGFRGRRDNSGPSDELAGGAITLKSAAPDGLDLSSGPGQRAGNAFEVFHYPAVVRRMERAMSYIYEHVTPKDDMAVVLTDFRFDDLFDHGPSTGAINVTVQGIGPSPRNPRPGENFNSTKLQVCPTPIYMGPRFAKNVEDEERQYTNYAFGVGWIIHELTHKWSAFIEADIPGSDDRQVLVGGAHWARGFHNPSFVSTAAAYSDDPYTETSPMGGGHWDENPDGTFSRRPTPYLVPVGMSAFDLYNMGLLTADEVPDTFVLVDLQPVGENRYRARKLPVRIEDVIKAAGPRSPSPEHAQREFHFTAYILHEPGREPDPAKVQQGKDIEQQVARHFEMATGGRMKVTTGAGGSN